MKISYEWRFPARKITDFCSLFSIARLDRRVPTLAMTVTVCDIENIEMAMEIVSLSHEKS